MRLGNLGLATAVLIAFLANAFAGGNAPVENGPADRALQTSRVDQIAISTNDLSAIVTKIVVITKDCAYRSDTGNIRRRNVNTLGFTQDLPLVGGFFGDTPRRQDFSGANQIGLVYLDGATLFADLRPTEGSAGADPSQIMALANAPAGTANPPFTLDMGMPPLTGLSVVNRNYQFLVPGTYFTAVAPPGMVCAKDALATQPSMGTMNDKPVGTAHLTNGEVNLLVRPSILATN